MAHAVIADPTACGLLKVALLPDHDVSLAESGLPASDLSEQISATRPEASGSPAFMGASSFACHARASANSPALAPVARISAIR